MRLRTINIAPIASVLGALLIAPAAHAAVIDFEDVVTPAPPGLAAGAEIGLTGVPGSQFPQVSQGFNFGWEVIVQGITHGHISRAGGLVGDADTWIASNDPLAVDPVAASSTYVVTDDSFSADSFLEISPVDGVPFSIQSFEIAEWFSPQGSAQSVSVFGHIDPLATINDVADATLLNVALVGQDFLQIINPGDPTVFTGFQPITLVGPEWTGLSKVFFDGNGSTLLRHDYFAIDNITVNAPIDDDPNDPNDPNDPDGSIDVPEPSSMAIFGFAAIMLGWAARRRDGDVASAPRATNSG